MKFSSWWNFLPQHLACENMVFNGGRLNEIIVKFCTKFLSSVPLHLLHGSTWMEPTERAVPFMFSSQIKTKVQYTEPMRKWNSGYSDTGFCLVPHRLTLELWISSPSPFRLVFYCRSQNRFCNELERLFMPDSALFWGFHGIWVPIWFNGIQGWGSLVSIHCISVLK